MAIGLQDHTQHISTPEMHILEADQQVELVMTVVGGDPIPPSGLKKTVSWNPVSGATSIVVDDARNNLTGITPTLVLEDIDPISVQTKGNARVISNPGKLPIRQLTLRDLCESGEDQPVLPNQDSLSPLRLLVSTRESSQAEWTPLFAVRPVDSRNEMPSSLVGASYRNHVLRFPYALTGQIRVALVENDAPEDFRTKPMEVGPISARVEHPPTDLQLRLGDDQVLWEMPGPMPVSQGSTSVDVRVPIELAMQADLAPALEEGRPLKTELTLSAGSDSSATFFFLPPRGALLRRHDGVTRVKLEGESMPISFDEPLDEAVPNSVVADLHVRYDGLYLLGGFVDDIPAAGVSVSGWVVRTESRVRELPPQALAGHDIARVGLIGWSGEGCELDVQFRDSAGRPIGDAGLLEIEAANHAALHWVEMQARPDTNAPVNLYVTARSGQFFWINREQPAMRIAVRDPDPALHGLFLGDLQLDVVGAAGIARKNTPLPRHAFASTAGAPFPVLSSSLFLTVDFTDLTLRYNR